MVKRGRVPEGTVQLLFRLYPYLPKKAFKNMPSRLLIEMALDRSGRLEVCGICGKDPLGKYEFDHIVPLSKGGKHHIDNIQYACSVCNHRKGNKTNRVTEVVARARME